MIRYHRRGQDSAVGSASHYEFHGPGFDFSNLSTTLSVILRRQTDRNHPPLGKAADPLLTQETKTWRPVDCNTVQYELLFKSQRVTIQDHKSYYSRYKSSNTRYKSSNTRYKSSNTRYKSSNTRSQELQCKTQQLQFKNRSYNSRTGDTTSSQAIATMV